MGCEYLYVEARGPRRTRTVAITFKHALLSYETAIFQHSNSVRNFNSLHILYCTVVYGDVGKVF